MAEADTEDMGATLRRWRLAKGWTRRRAAQELNVSERTIENWEYGHRKPKFLPLLEKQMLKELRGPRRKGAKA